MQALIDMICSRPSRRWAAWAGLLAMVLLSGAPSTGAHAQTHAQLAREYHAIVFATQRAGLIDQHARAARQSAGASAAPEEIYRAWVASVLDSPEYEEAMVTTYQEFLGIDELRGVVANARLPAYHQYMVDQPLLDRVRADRTAALLRSREAELVRRLEDARRGGAWR